jgi:hypothetical protein
MAIDLNVSEASKSRAAARAAETLLRTMGNAEVKVRVVVPLSGDADQSQIGLGTLVTEDVAIAPVVVRPAKDSTNNLRPKRREILIAAGTLVKAREMTSVEAVTAFFENAVGVLIGETLMRMESVMVEDFAGTAYMYRVIVGE